MESSPLHSRLMVNVLSRAGMTIKSRFGMCKSISYMRVYSCSFLYRARDDPIVSDSTRICYTMDYDSRVT
jgi:hypothetical protein